MVKSAYIDPNRKSARAKKNLKVLMDSVKKWNDIFCQPFNPEPEDCIPISYCRGVMNSSVAIRMGIPIGPPFWKPEVTIKGRRYAQGIMY